MSRFKRPPRSVREPSPMRRNHLRLVAMPGVTGALFLVMAAALLASIVLNRAPLWNAAGYRADSAFICAARGGTDDEIFGAPDESAPGGDEGVEGVGDE